MMVNSIYFEISNLNGTVPTPADALALAHAQQLHESYMSALASFRQKKEELPEGAVAASGSYKDVIVNKDALLETWKSLDTKRGAQVMNMRSSDDESNKVTLYLTESRTNWLDNRLNAYRHSAGTDNRHSWKLIDALDAVSLLSGLNLSLLYRENTKLFQTGLKNMKFGLQEQRLMPRILNTELHL